MAAHTQQRFVPFKKGEKVWLEVQNLKCSVTNPKFAPKREGPFTITKVLSLITYQLCLPKTWKIHLVFHATLLSSYRENNIHGLNFPAPPTWPHHGRRRIWNRSDPAPQRLPVPMVLSDPIERILGWRRLLGPRTGSQKCKFHFEWLWKVTPHHLFSLTLFLLMRSSPSSNTISCPALTTQTSFLLLLSLKSLPLCWLHSSLPHLLSLIPSPSSNPSSNLSLLCIPRPPLLNKKSSLLCPSLPSN